MNISGQGTPPAAASCDSIQDEADEDTSAVKGAATPHDTCADTPGLQSAAGVNNDFLFIHPPVEVS